jgi:uncharacterized protein
MATSKTLSRPQSAAKSKVKSAPKLNYDCGKCPGYCCSYPRIEVKDSDVERLAKHLKMSVEEVARKYTRMYDKSERILRQQKDEVYGKICRFFDTTERRCTVYEGRPSVCREYPNKSKCGYYEFIKFEREQQEDKTYLPMVRA